MTCCEILMNLGIGIVSGLISGIIGSICLKKHWDKLETEKKFESEKQEYSRYLHRIRYEIEIGKRAGDYSGVLRSIEDESIRETFEQLDALSSQSISDIAQYIKEIKTIFEKGKDVEAKLAEIQGKLFKYRVDVLKYRRKDK